MHPEIVKLLGRLHFRQSYSQNVLDHSVEVAHLMGLMASELGIDPAPAKRAGLLHDIGKAVSHEFEGPHAVVGADFIKRYGESDAVVNGVASHHYDVPPIGPLGILVSAADAISASRPGARSETMTTYLKRIEDLEKIALSFPGVDKCFAVQAGRELRVLVHHEQVNDEQAFRSRPQHRAQDRGKPAISRPDKDHRHPRNALRGSREVVQTAQLKSERCSSPLVRPDERSHTPTLPAIGIAPRTWILGAATGNAQSQQQK